MGWSPDYKCLPHILLYYFCGLSLCPSVPCCQSKLDYREVYTDVKGSYITLGNIVILNNLHHNFMINYRVGREETQHLSNILIDRGLKRIFPSPLTSLLSHLSSSLFFFFCFSVISLSRCQVEMQYNDIYQRDKVIIEKLRGNILHFSTFGVIFWCNKPEGFLIKIIKKMYARRSLSIIIIKIYLKFQTDINGTEGREERRFSLNFCWKCF